MPAPPSTRSAASRKPAADIVRVSCPDEDATKAMKAITKAAAIPVVADIHFHYKRAIEAAVNGAACLRINPGNIGSAQRVREVVQAAKDHGCSMRIGVNAGSLEPDLLEKYGEPCPEAMVESALNHAKILDDLDFREYKISVKASDPFLAVAAYQALAEAIDCPLHVGITEAGGMISGTVKSSIGMGMLLWSGIGDTIRVSLSADPVEEVRVGLRHPQIAQSAPSRRQHHFLPVLRAAGLQCHRHGQDAGRAAQAHRHADVAVDHRLRGQRPGRGARNRSGLHRRRRRQGPWHDLSQRQAQPTSSDNDDLVEHVVELCEKKAAEIEAAAQRRRSRSKPRSS